MDLGILGLVPMTDALDTLAAGPGHAEDLDREGGLASVVAELWRTTTKPWVAVVDAGPLYDPLRERLGEAGVPVLGTADAATRVLNAWCDATVPSAAGQGAPARWRSPRDHPKQVLEAR